MLELAELHLKPLWAQPPGGGSSEPRTAVQPYLWRWTDVRGALFEAARGVDPAQAERRALVLCNPGLDGRPLTTQSIAAGFQLVLPGEFARAHRHINSSLRFIVEGRGGYTVTEGEKSLLAPGDFVSSPNWTWHDHGNEGAEPVIWFDAVDMPIVATFNAQAFEAYGEPRQAVGATSGWAARVHQPYARHQAALASSGQVELDTCVPTLAASLQRLAAGKAAPKRRQMASSVMVVHKGEGHSVVGEERFEWQPHDVLVVPSWTWHKHVASKDAVVFSVTDRPALAALGLYREEHD
jgi:gentisate 1,2-dioxygenase